MTQVRVGGVWLPTIAGVGDLTWSTTATGGSEEATWRMPLPETFTHPALVPGKLVQLREGSANVFGGVLSQPRHNADGWDFTATGLADQLYTAHLCLDGSGNTTSVPDVAVDQAIADGFPGSRPVSLSSVPFAQTEQTDSLNYVGELLDAWATSLGKRWAVSPDGVVYAYDAPTVPTWHMSPGSTRIGLAEDDYSSDIYLRYRPTATTFATVHVSDPAATTQLRRASKEDLADRGILTSGAAQAIGEGMITNGKARFAWTEPVNPNRFQLTTPGGQPAYLPFVKAGQMVRSFGVINEQGRTLPYCDWVIGKTQLVAGAREIQLAPTELAARTLGDRLALALA